VPRKILASLVNEYTTIDKIYDRLHEQKLTVFQRGALLDSKNRVATNLKLIVLNRHLDSIVCDEGVYDKDGIVDLFDKYEIRSMKPDNIIDIFSSSLNIKYSDPRDVVKVESFSLFD
jgi:hypothetical protein